MSVYDSVCKELQAAGANLRCSRLGELLESLGFAIKSGKTEGHKIYTHSGLPSFTSSSYNCGHGRNGEVKPNYLVVVLRTLRLYRDELRKFLGEKDE